MNQVFVVLLSVGLTAVAYLVVMALLFWGDSLRDEYKDEPYPYPYRVLYPDGHCSRVLSFTKAMQLAQRVDGTVVRN